MSGEQLALLLRGWTEFVYPLHSCGDDVILGHPEIGMSRSRSCDSVLGANSTVSFVSKRDGPVCSEEASVVADRRQPGLVSDLRPQKRHAGHSCRTGVCYSSGELGTSGVF